MMFNISCNRLKKNIQRQGTTVLIVSHNLTKIQELCQRVAWLSRGELKMVGDPAEVVQAYRENI